MGVLNRSAEQRPPERVGDPEYWKPPSWMRLYIAVGICVCVFLVLFGGISAWQDIVTRAGAYDRLRAHGQQETARLVSCSGLPGNRHNCKLTLRYGGREREWRYEGNLRQFHGLPDGSAIPVLVDPGHPNTVYTVRDVQNNANAGWSGLGIFDLALFAIGLAGLYWLARLITRYRRAYGSLRHPVVPQR